MNITIEIAQEFIVLILIDANRKGNLHSSAIANFDYDVHLDTAMAAYKQYHQINTDLRFEHDNLKRDKIQKLDKKCKQLFSDAIWDLCRKGILRPGPSFVSDTYKQPQLVNEGFAVTKYGQDWIMKFTIDDLLPADPNRLSQVFEKYQKLFGVNCELPVRPV